MVGIDIDKKLIEIAQKNVRFYRDTRCILKSENTHEISLLGSDSYQSWSREIDVTLDTIFRPDAATRYPR